MIIRTYKYRIYPNKEQAEKIDYTLDLCRWLYNSALEQRITAYKKHGKSISYYEQQNELPQLKKELPEFKEVYSQVLQDVLRRLDKAFKNFFRRLKQGERRAGFPRFQGKNRYRSITYPQASRTPIKNNRIRLGKIGHVRINLSRNIQGTMKTCTVVRKNGKYYVMITAEDTEIRVLNLTGKVVGVDLGISHLAITSDGKFYENAKHLRRSEKQLKRLQRTVSRRKKGSNRRRKAVELLAKKHEQIANQRADTNHKISRKLVEQYDLIVFEDLNINGMVKNKHLAKSIYEVAWKQLIEFTQYKAENAGKEVLLVNPYNTSQKCFNCGEIVKKTLSERTHKCNNCGYTEDRDINAAKNILQLGLEY